LPALGSEVHAILKEEAWIGDDHMEGNLYLSRLPAALMQCCASEKKYQTRRAFDRAQSARNGDRSSQW